MDYETQAAGFYAMGEQKLKKKRFGRGYDYDGAIEDFDKSANYFKMCSNFSRAAEAFQQIADLQLKLGKPQLAVNPLQNALNCSNKSSNTELSSVLIKKLIDTCMLSGRFIQAGKTTREMAQKAEETGDFESAANMYQRAAEILSSESNTASEIRNCRLKLAEIKASYQDKYSEAYRIYEEVGTECLSIRLLQFHVRDYYLNAWLCFICNDVEDVQGAKSLSEKYQRMDPAMPDSANADFMNSAVQPLEECDSEGFYACASSFFKRTGRGREPLLKRLCNEIMDKLDAAAEADNDEFIAGDDEEVEAIVEKEKACETGFDKISNEINGGTPAAHDDEDTDDLL